MTLAATPNELAVAKQWLQEHLNTAGPAPAIPLSFKLGDDAQPCILTGWQSLWAAPTSQPGLQFQTLTLSDPETGLQIRIEAKLFADYPAVEWIAHFKNTGAQDTPIIADIQALDTLFPLAKEAQARVHHANGSLCRMDDFAPLESLLNGRAHVSLGPSSGRSSSGALPFFNIEMAGAGVIAAVGWTGGWTANLDRDGTGIHVRAGLRQTHLRLHPGEEIRTPRMLLLFFQGDRLRAHNLWRRLLLAHYIPKHDGQPISVPISDAVWGERTEETQVGKVRWLHDNGIGTEYLWIDAGWYGEREHFNPNADTFGIEWAVNVGNWWPIKEAYPSGLGPVGEACRRAGMGFVLWFEPERAYENARAPKEHPEWFLGPHKGWLPGLDYMLNLGHPEARRYITDAVSGQIAAGGITCYRQDFNFNPDVFWQTADAPDRIGMAEIRHIEGLYAFWDELLARHPGLIIDNCAGGGQRIDLETISRSVPLWRSDIQCVENFDPIAMQTQTQGLCPWVPLSSGCCSHGTLYAGRSAVGPGLVCGWADRLLEMHRDWSLDTIRQIIREEKAVRPYFYGDYYPLVSFSLADDAWAVWQCDRPDLGEGAIIALRRPASPFPRFEGTLRGLDPTARYELRDADSREVSVHTGQELLEKGIKLEIADKPGSRLVFYKRI